MNTNSSSKGKREIESLTFRPAKNGVISEASFRTQRGGQGGGPVHDYDSDKPMMHRTREEAHAEVDRHFGKHWGDSTEDGSPDRETKADKE